MLLGDSGVGKSSILTRFNDGEYKHNLIGTAGIDFRNKTVEIDNQSLRLEIWDTAG